MRMDMRMDMRIDMRMDMRVDVRADYMGIGHTPRTVGKLSSRRVILSTGGVGTRAVDVPPAMADIEPSAMADIEPTSRCSSPNG